MPGRARAESRIATASRGLVRGLPKTKSHMHLRASTSLSLEGPRGAKESWLRLCGTAGGMSGELVPSLAQVEMPVRLASVPRISWMFARCAPGGGGGVAGVRRAGAGTRAQRAA